LRECDFGMFEGKNYRELSGCPEYQAWIDSGGTLPFPDGESREQFLTRSCAAVSEIVQTYNSDRIAIVAHGGTMMAVFSACEMHQKSYFDWKIPHCEPFLCEVFCKNPLQLQWKERN
ncbi:MAG: histidine phosphatase family protein, partial [Ruminococcus sp.]|nr:histidine phosphatase family protein [Ruminococcus sp.]